jgi:hypothetical protein
MTFAPISKTTVNLRCSVEVSPSVPVRSQVSTRRGCRVSRPKAGVRRAQPGCRVAERLAQRDDDRADGGRVAAGRGNAATSSTKNRVQHAEVIGLGFAPALPGHNSATSVSPVASAKHNSV